ncbi:hypothetical protein N7532_008497 [Penicillium argentinense]|uniref:Uncharacterized protein n=1 Tax=Penicillium argentinense TaxID=1131581 RepID=A0A9W9EXF6_9EURO|nr:uncharacterized protein N7532_008497 [Penicillium argentinense]KAJ5089813.1 hypothetical protein N7532_008497 [Penicillium argentinense]
MQDILIVHDNASIRSGASFSTACHSVLPPIQPLRRRNTVTTLRRWVSKRMLRPSLDGTGGHDLSEKNLMSLDLTTRMRTANDDTSTSDQLSFEKMDQRGKYPERIGPVQESTPTLPNHGPQDERDQNLLQEYDAFCHQFTLSGAPHAKRVFDMSMGMEGREEKIVASTSHLFLDSHLAEESRPVHGLNETHANTETPLSKQRPLDMMRQSNYRYPESSSIVSAYGGLDTTAQDANVRIPSISYPRPPSQVVTPTVYMEMQRTARERKLARQKSLWQPLRSLFSTEPSPKHCS